MTARGSTRLIVYAAGRQGLGQTMRALRMIEHIRAGGRPVEATLISGVRGAADLFGVQHAVTILSPPEVVVLTEPEWRRTPDRRRLLIGAATERVQSIVGQISPEVFVTTSHRGVAGELTPVLRVVRQQGSRVILLLRDIYYPPRYEQDYARLTPRDFDRVLVAAPSVVARWLPRALTSKPMASVVTFGGYLAPLSPLYSLAPADRCEIELLCQVGGGRDGRRLIEAALALKIGLARSLNKRVRLRAYCGPLMSATEVAALRARAGEVADISIWRSPHRAGDAAEVQAANLLVSMAGYNSCVESAVSAIPTLLVPRIDPQDAEQDIRAELFSGWFSQLGAVRLGLGDELASAAKLLLASAPPEARLIEHFATPEAIAAAALG